MTTALLVLALAAPTVQVKLHPAFIKTPEQLEAAWILGEKDGKRKADFTKQLNRTRQTIGSYRTGVMSSKGSSFVWYVPPEIRPYNEAFQAVTKYKPEEEVSKSKEESIPKTTQALGTIYFYGSITLMPMFAGGYGRVSRDANPNDLADVRVVLKVGDAIIQPDSQPGNLLKRQGSELNSFSIPRYQYSTTNSSASGSAYGPGGYAYGTATGQSTTVTTYVEHHEEGWNWYQGDFFVGFKIVDKDGKPLITDGTKEMELLVIYGGTERHAKYKLADLVKPYK